MLFNLLLVSSEWEEANFKGKMSPRDKNKNIPFFSIGFIELDLPTSVYVF